MRAAVHALALPALALLTAVPALGLTTAGHSAAPAPRFAAAIPALRLRGGGDKDAGGKVRLRRAGQHAPRMPGPCRSRRMPHRLQMPVGAQRRCDPADSGARFLSPQAPEAGKGKGDAKGAKVFLSLL